MYATVLQRYEEAGYIRKVPATEQQPEQVWYLPHFPVLRPDKSTTKVCVVFDGSAKCGGVSRNNMIYQGPKLQRDVMDVLLRFHRHPVGLICDIAEMYLQIEIPEIDRPYHRFLWRGCNQNRLPDQYEFFRVFFWHQLLAVSGTVCLTRACQAEPG